MRFAKDRKTPAHHELARWIHALTLGRKVVLDVQGTAITTEVVSTPWVQYTIDGPRAVASFRGMVGPQPLSMVIEVAGEGK